MASLLIDSGRRNSLGGCSSCAGNTFGAMTSMTSFADALADALVVLVRVFMLLSMLNEC